MIWAGLAGGESVDVHLPAGGTCGRSGQGFQIRLQLVGIVGQGFEFLARNGDSSRIVRRVHVDGRRSVRNLNFLGFHFDRHHNVELERLIGDDNVVILIQSKPCGCYGQGVFPGSQGFEFIQALAIALDHDWRSGGGCHDHAGGGNGRAGGIGNLSAKRSRGRLRE